jgi:hypothetical protein
MRYLGVTARVSVLLRTRHVTRFVLVSCSSNTALLALLLSNAAHTVTYVAHDGTVWPYTSAVREAL